MNLMVTLIQKHKQTKQAAEHTLGHIRPKAEKEIRTDIPVAAFPLR